LKQLYAKWIRTLPVGKQNMIGGRTTAGGKIIVTIYDPNCVSKNAGIIE
jgi:hypothetical protein